MGFSNKLAVLGLSVTFVAVYILQGWSSSNEISSLNPVKPLKSTQAAQPNRRNTLTSYTTSDPTIKEHASNVDTTDNLSQNGNHMFVDRRKTIPANASIFDSTKIDPAKHDDNYQHAGTNTPTQVFANTTAHSLMNNTKYSAPDQPTSSQSSLCDKPPRDAGFDELHRRYRECMGGLVSLALDGGNGKVSPTSLDEQTPHEGHGLLVGEGWREMAGRLAAVKRGCRVPAVEFTGAPVLADVIFDKTHHLAYCRHGKAGTTSLLSLLLWLNHVDPTPLTNNQLHKSIFTYLPTPTQESQRDLLERSFSFTAVRHPFRRLVSAYCDKEVVNRLDILSNKIRNLSPEQREEELLEYNYRVESGTKEPTLLAGPWIRRAVTDWSLSEGGQENGSLLAHYLSAVDFNSTQKEIPLETTTDIQGVHTEVGRNQTTPNLSSAEPFRMFVHGVLLDLLNCGSDTSCLGLTDRHIKPQVIRWNPCVLNFDMVMKVETLDQDIELLKDLLGLPDSLSEGEEDPIGRNEEIPEERREEDSNPERIQKTLRSRMAVPQSDDAGLELRAGKETQTYKEIDGFVTIENQVGNMNFVENAYKLIDLGEKVTNNTPGAQSEFNSDTGFFKRNTRSRKCGTYEENMKQLSRRDIDLLYTCYYWDFKLFGYEPFD